ncbi:MAG TPA: M28 family peptidase, partial [Gemmatimonadaceae bacterium]|nr:M28 family peptidase [Gemmatimonadaceae bacterium]
MRTLLLLLPLLVAAPLAAQVPDTDVWVASLTRRGDSFSVTGARNVTSRPGYDNQPAWVGGEALLYVSRRDGQTDVWRVEVGGGAPRQLTRTAESEYSPTLTPDGRGIAVVRVERDSTQRLWRFPLSGAGAPRLLLPAVRPVGYFAWSGPSTLALFVLGSPNSLQVARLGDASANTVASGIGRSLQPVPGTPAVSFIHHDGGTATVKRLDPASGDVRPLFAALPESDDLAWVDSATALMARGARVYASRGGDWREVADLAAAGVGRITRLAVSPDRRRLAFVAETAAPARAGARAEDVRRLVHALAADSMEGRRTATPGIARAERLIAEEFRRIGLRAGGDDGGYLQRVPLAAVERNGRPGLALLPSLAALDTVPRERRREGANVVGVIPGGDPSLRDEVVVVGAHHDHIGVRGPAVNGDSLNNGADDDASGVVAV